MPYRMLLFAAAFQNGCRSRTSLVPSPLPAAILWSERWSGILSRKACHCRRPGICPIRLSKSYASYHVIYRVWLLSTQHFVMDIPRLDVKGVSVELVNDAIKHAFLALG